MASIERILTELQTSEHDDRSYRFVRLPNKIEALLVHDPNTDKASAAMSVGVGSFSDPDNRLGTAHAVEHLLFMGSKKYPLENEYDKYITTHSGRTNAYTNPTETDFYFEVEASAFYGALDRFAQFFKEPLFLASAVDSELRTVDSEHKKDIQSDSRRISQLTRSLSSPRHPYQRFFAGSLMTLRDEARSENVELSQAFKQFYSKHYSANRMKLVVLSRESLDTSESWIDDLFADVQNKDLPPDSWDDVQLFSKKEALTQIFVKPVMDYRYLSIEFPFQHEENIHMYESQPSSYISHLIRHEGPGGILAYLKMNNWANNLFAEATSRFPGPAFFTITITLTENGLKEFKEVVRVVFQYISLIKNILPQEWIFDEVSKMANIDFRFQEKDSTSNFTMKSCQLMQTSLPRDWLFKGSNFPRKFDSTAIAKAMSYLRTDNYRLVIVNQNITKDWDRTERWYGTKYRLQRIDDDLKHSVRETEKAEDRISNLHLPHKNEFIPNRLTVEKKDVAEPLKTPKLIRNDEVARTWWKKDDQFWVPKTNVFIILRNLSATVTSATSLMTRIFCLLVEDALTTDSYDAEKAGLCYKLHAFNVEVHVHVMGYNDKLDVLLEKVLVHIRDLTIDPDCFNIVKERVSQEFRLRDFQDPCDQIHNFSRSLVLREEWSNEQYLAALVDLTADDISIFFPQLFRQIHIEILAHGNIYKEDALRMTNLVESTLKSRSLSRSLWQMRRGLILPQGSNFTFQRTHPDPDNLNHAVEYIVYVGEVADRDLRAKLLLLVQMTKEPIFNQLRTKENLGYVVRTDHETYVTTMGYQIIVQSERLAEYLEERINAFLTSFSTLLDEMSTEVYEIHKKCLIYNLLEKDKNLDQESYRFEAHIASGYFDFQQKEHDVACLKILNKRQMLEFFNQYILPASSRRAKLSVHLNAQAPPKATLTGLKGDDDVEPDTLVPDKPALQPIIEQIQRPGLEVDQPSGQAIHIRPTVFIENVHDFKAGLAVSARPTSETDLSTFEE